MPSYLSFPVPNNDLKNVIISYNLDVTSPWGQTRSLTCLYPIFTGLLLVPWLGQVPRPQDCSALCHEGSALVVLPGISALLGMHVRELAVVPGVEW